MAFIPLRQENNWTRYLYKSKINLLWT